MSLSENMTDSQNKYVTFEMFSHTEMYNINIEYIYIF